jgi:hypothetical protein
MAKVTITFEDMEEGVTVAVESDPPLPENIQEEAENLTDAQQMALSMAMMFDNQMQEEHEQQPEKKSDETEGVVDIAKDFFKEKMDNIYKYTKEKGFFK